MENEEKITVIVCCFNPSLEKLYKTIFSIERQKDVDFDIVITDDGSRDKYENKLKTWANQHSFFNITYNFLVSNVGTVSNIVSAIKVSDGFYVKTISPGDFLHDEYSLFYYLETFKKTNADIVYGKARYFTPQYKLVKSTSPQNKLTFSRLFQKRNVCLYGDFILGASIAAKKEIELKYLSCISPSIKYLEDVPLTFLALFDGKKIVCCHKFLVWYEYGLGISTHVLKKGEHSLLESDFLVFYDFLDKRYQNSKFTSHVLKIRKFLQKSKSKSYFWKFFHYPFYDFGYFLYSIGAKLPKISILNKKEKDNLRIIKESETSI
jgi:glycosyltransferase involved in cell wall biosynthesis